MADGLGFIDFDIEGGTSKNFMVSLSTTRYGNRVFF
jgi:hypothetical protein